MAVIFVSGCLGENVDDKNSSEVQSISKGGVLLKYPSNWVVSESTSNHSLLSVSAADSIDSSKVGQVNVNVEEKELTSPLDTFVNQTSASLNNDPSYDLISTGGVKVAGKDGIEVIYKSDVNGTMKMHKAVWFENNGKAIVVLCSAPENQFEDNLNIFNFIIGNIQIS